jgi:hypothetical protein
LKSINDMNDKDEEIYEMERLEFLKKKKEEIN